MVSRPQIYRVYQAKAATRRNRSNAQIDQIVLHTPEGYEGGTLAVLQNGRAGFDWFLPPSGNLYKTNAFAKYVAWQAGYWPSNLRSIGVEQWDFAANMGNAPDAHYDRLADLVAWLTQLLDIPVRHAAWDQSGLVSHAQITPNSRTDPGKDFDWERLISKVNAKRSGGKPAAAPAQSKTIYRVQLGAFSQRGGADTLLRRVKGAGFDAFVTRSGGYYKVQSGAFGVRDNAEDRARALGRKGFGTFIDAGKKA